MNFNNPAPGTPAQPAPTVSTPPAAPALAPLAPAPTATAANRQVVGRLVAVSGAQVTVGVSLGSSTADAARATVGKFLGIVSGSSLIVGMITEISERPPRDQEPHCRSTARLDLVGEIKTLNGALRFQRGITEYPAIGEAATLMSIPELRLIFGSSDTKLSPIGALQQETSIPASVDIDPVSYTHLTLPTIYSV